MTLLPPVSKTTNNTQQNNRRIIVRWWFRPRLLLFGTYELCWSIMAIQRSNIANSNNGVNGGGKNNNRARDLSPISPRSSSNTSSAQFNPRLILSQIISLQSFHYLVLGVIFQINHVLFATSITMDRIFTSKYLDVWSAYGWIDNAAVLLSSLIG